MSILTRSSLTAGAVIAATTLMAVGCATFAPKVETLQVAVIEAGGPALPGGGTPKQPVVNAEVTVTGAGRSLSSRTGRTGVATFRLPTGSYLISSPTCGSTGTEKATVTAERSASLTWWCPVA